MLKNHHIVDATHRNAGWRAAGLCLLLLLTGGCGSAGDRADKAESQIREAFITLIDAEGEQHRVDLAALELIRQQGALIRSTGTMEGPTLFTGPTLDAVLAIVGGIRRGQAIRITAGDGYRMVFTYDQAAGHIMTYDEAGHALTVGGTMPMLALAGDGPGLTDGFPRLAFVSEASLLTDGHFWIRDIAEIAVTEDVSEWVLSMYGLREYVMDRSTFESLATCPDTPHPAQRWEREQGEGDPLVYDGVPLWVLISTIDGAEHLAPHYRFNRSLAREGYTVQVVGQDGDTATFQSMEVAYNDDLFLAYRINNAFLDDQSGPLMLTGPFLRSGARQVRRVAEIRLTDLPE